MRVAKAAVKKLMLATGSSKRTLDTAKGTLVLCYHSIPDEGDWVYDVPIAAFEKQLEFLKDNYQIRKASDVLHPPVKDELQAIRVALTFDDGYEDNYTNVFPVIRKQKIPVTFFVTVDYIGDTENKVVELPEGIEKRMMSWRQLKEMAKSDLVDFGSHGSVHRDVTKLSPSAALADMAKSRRILEKNLGRSVSLFSYPGGFFTAATSALLPRAGYAGAFTSLAIVNGANTSPYEIGRVAITRRNSDLASFVYLLGRVAKMVARR